MTPEDIRREIKTIQEAEFRAGATLMKIAVAQMFSDAGDVDAARRVLAISLPNRITPAA